MKQTLKTILALSILFTSQAFASRKMKASAFKNPPANCHISVTSYRKDGKKFNKTYRISEVSKERCNQAGDRHREVNSPLVRKKVVKADWYSRDISFDGMKAVRAE